MAERRIAFVRWVDSTSYKKLAEDETADIDYIENAGIIKEETKEYINLALYWNHTPDHFTETISIPKVCIKKIRRFTIK